MQARESCVRLRYMSEGLFISYRRSDSQGSTGRLTDHLRQNGFGSEGDMFLDIDARIPPGVNFRKVIDETLAKCDLVIVVIGRHWLDATDSKGRRRLDRPSDTHRLEVASALESEARVIPVLVEGADHPSEEYPVRHERSFRLEPRSSLEPVKSTSLCGAETAQRMKNDPLLSERRAG